MKIAHLFLPHIFSKYVIDFLNNNFKDKGYDCIIISRKAIEPEFTNIEGAEYHVFNGIREEYDFLVKISEQYNHIYLHSSFLSPLEKMMMRLLSPQSIKKYVWVCWGYDLYKNQSFSFSEYIKNLFKRWVQLLFDKKIPIFVGIHPVDLVEYGKRIKGTAKLYVMPYRFSTKQDPYLLTYEKRPIKDKQKKGEPITIQIAHRAEPEMHHIKILKMLSAYKNESIRIVMPMSYGNHEYALSVEKYAHSIFGNKIEILYDMLPYQDYLNCLDKIDILIIDSYRQIALGNIYPMLYMQKKVFLPKQSLMYEYFRENGVKVFDLETIGKESWETIIADEDLSEGRNFIINYLSENPKDVWEKVFEDINKQ